MNEEGAASAWDCSEQSMPTQVQVSLLLLQLLLHLNVYSATFHKPWPFIPSATSWFLFPSAPGTPSSPHMPRPLSLISSFFSTSCHSADPSTTRKY